jgi:hypothetical protein
MITESKLNNQPTLVLTVVGRLSLRPLILKPVFKLVSHKENQLVTPKVITNLRTNYLFKFFF